MNQWSPRERRLVAVGILVALLVLAVFGVILPIASGFSDRADQREQLADDLDRGDRLLASRAFWLAAAARQRADRTRYAIVAPNAGAATELATERATAVIHATGGEVRTIREQPSTPDTSRLRVEARLSLTQLVAALRIFELGQFTPVIEAVSIDAGQASGAGRLAPMEVRIDLAYRHVPAL
ncbi:hypothetical protein [Polymorphobacter megasporae]|uniref:hypothetical protein n=1 Tax=Glacieibacterium megasporae TaxID=2835787 RepID=UPI001C1E51A7|nr:hypothetical protein [Polymorphobacter megasporae]UAJ09060.1 hypothetical protein KTC28_11945 [Polymorphobacter megasporae]